MSGGVDSTMAALLLQEEGHEVVGVTLNLWSYAGRQESYNDCCSLAVVDVARQLGIEHHFLDFGQLFKREVVDRFVQDYLRGRTPSPCIWCNARVRFPALLAVAEELGCEKVATGHHVRLTQEDGLYHLLRGRDPRKDQSYFLYGLSQRELQRAIFPIGELTKEEVYELARARGLSAAERPESQDLCFLPEGDYRSFLRESAGAQITPGEIVDTHGRVLGRHEGLPFYTIGQRQGLGLAAGKRLYVVDLDPERNRVIVGPEEELYATGLIATEVNWPAGQPAGEAKVEAEVKIRYRSPLVGAQVEPLGEDGGRGETKAKVKVTFKEPQRAVTPGQAVVFYQGERLLGGGLIEGVLRGGLETML